MSSSFAVRAAGSVAVAGLLASWLAMAYLLQGSLSSVFPNVPATVYVIHSFYVLAFAPAAALAARRGARARAGKSARALLFAAALLAPFTAVVAGTWYISLPLTAVGTNTALYNAAPAFVAVFSAVALPNEALTPARAGAVAVTLAGVATIWATTRGEGSGGGGGEPRDTPAGVAWVLASAVLYSVYEVWFAVVMAKEEGDAGRGGGAARRACGALRRWWRDGAGHRGSGGGGGGGGDEDVAGAGATTAAAADSRAALLLRGGAASPAGGSPAGAGGGASDPGPPATPPGGASAAAAAARRAADKAEAAALVLAGIGLWTLLLGWPVMLLPDTAPPSRAAAALLATNGALDVLYNLCLLVGIALLSPLTMAAASVLVVPLGLAVDALARGAAPTPGAGAGAGLIVAGFVALVVAGRRERAAGGEGDDAAGAGGPREALVPSSAAGETA